MKIGEIWICTKQGSSVSQVFLNEKVKITRLEHNFYRLMVVSESLDTPYIENFHTSEFFLENFKKVYNESR